MKKQELRGMLKGALLTMLVMSLVFTALAAGKMIEVTSGINLKINGQTFTPTDVNGSAVEVFAYNGTTYVPLRAISQAFGKNVGWDGSTSTVTIDTPQNLRTIYMTKTGEKYHYDGSCNGGTYFETTLEQALKIGLEPCAKCVK